MKLNLRQGLNENQIETALLGRLRSLCDRHHRFELIAYKGLVVPGKSRYHIDFIVKIESLNSQYLLAFEVLPIGSTPRSQQIIIVKNANCGNSDRCYTCVGCAFFLREIPGDMH